MVVWNFLSQVRAVRESATERRDKSLISFACFCTSGLRSGLGKGRCCAQPKAHEDRQSLHGDTKVALHARHASIELVETFRYRSLLVLGCAGREEGGDTCLGGRKRTRLNSRH